MTNPTQEEQDFELSITRKPSPDDGTPMRPMGPTNHDGIQTLQKDDTQDLPKGPTNHDAVLQTHGRTDKRTDRPTGPTNHDVIPAGDDEEVPDGPTNHDSPTTHP
jgi:hypothetical protein